jgi:hypothetical protein
VVKYRIEAYNDFLDWVDRNSVTSSVFIELFAFPIRNITLILKRRARTNF